jgi:hypothetical protein
MMIRRLTVPALIATLLATAACSGGGAPATAPSNAMPAAALEPVSPTTAVQSIAVASEADDITPADIAAIDAPASVDVPDPTGDEADASGYGWPLTGFYHGKLKGYSYNGFGGNIEHSGYLAMHIDAHLPSYTGTGVATEYGTGATLSFTLSGPVASYFPHGEYLNMTAVDSTGCPASGSARRYRYLFEGVLNSAGCGANSHGTTYYFKVRPNKT